MRDLGRLGYVIPESIALACYAKNIPQTLRDAHLGQSAIGASTVLFLPLQDVHGRMCGKCRGVPVTCPAGSLEQGGVSSGDVLRSGSPLFLLEGHSPSKEEVLKTVQHCGRSL